MKVLGYALRCNHYCLDHKPLGLNRGERRDLVEVTKDDACVLESDCDEPECNRTLGEVAAEKGLA